jgi:hypothetical protein
VNANTTAAPLTLEGVRDAVAVLAAAQAKNGLELLKAWMRGLGFDPDQGARMVVPAELRPSVEDLVRGGSPAFVYYSSVASQPYLVGAPSARLSP